MTRLTPKEIGYIVRKAIYLRRLGIETASIKAEELMLKLELDKLEKELESEEDKEL